MPHVELTLDTLLATLRRHIGRRQGVTATALCREVLGIPPTAGDERHLRELVVELRKGGHHVCAHPRDGYFLAQDADELEETCAFLRSRSMSGLEQVAAMKRVSIPDLVGQMRMPT
ncbi:hypothetical protein KR767_04240 [Luteibacter anthropi]|uniref:hypothetical protein n=1 Tax=Luteibacter anthropi TaxID=564369 RepID=UPI00203271D6|nr:hypothetical protein [Luteibacter anthropi]URX63287.1 hypothetical protein KR767_04240 [Luteibacter anthropi]